MATKKNYDAINFKNKDVDRFATKFGNGDPKKKANGDPKKKEPAKKEPEGERNPDYINAEKEKGRNWSPYSVNTLANEVRTPVKESFTKAGYGPKRAWNYVEPGELTKQDSLNINANRAPTIRNFKVVEKGMAEGVKFPGLTPEFNQSYKNYKRLPEKFK